MFDPTSLLNQFLGADSSKTLAKGKSFISQNSAGLAGGAAIGGLGGYLLGSKKGRKVAKKAATYGGMALLAGLAYKAYKNHQQGKSPAAAAPVSQQDIMHPDASFEIHNQPDPGSFSATLISAMIAAAKADGHIDATEQQAIFNKIGELDFDNDTKAFLFDQLNNPASIDNLVAAATTQEQAMEIYVASLMAIDVDTAAEKAYLAMLAARLKLEDDLVAQIHSTIEQELIEA